MEMTAFWEEEDFTTCEGNSTDVCIGGPGQRFFPPYLRDPDLIAVWIDSPV